MAETVADMGPEFQLIQNDWEIDEMLQYIGRADLIGDAGVLFVAHDHPQGNPADGLLIYLCESNIPRMNNYVWEIYPNDTY